LVVPEPLLIHTVMLMAVRGVHWQVTLPVEEREVVEKTL
jgi:hypothetical protein